MTLHEQVTAARRRLANAGVVDAAHDAEFLARHLLQWDRATFLVRRHERPPDQFDRDYAHLVDRRAAREPAALIVGARAFWGLQFEISADTLTPRPETELVVEQALLAVDRAGDGARIVDMGTGSGCIGIAIAVERPGTRLVATDISAAALSIAYRNARRHGVRERVSFVRTDVLDAITPGLDLIVSNPPYVESTVIADLDPEVTAHEPHVALDGGPDGLRVIRRLLAQSVTHLRPGGRLIFEFGAGQRPLVEDAVHATGTLRLTDVRADMSGLPRVAIVDRPGADESTTAGEDA